VILTALLRARERIRRKSLPCVLGGSLAALAVLCPARALAVSKYLQADQIRVNHYAQIESAKLGGLELPGGAANFIVLKESPLHSLPERGPGDTVIQGAADTSCTDAQGAEVGPAAHCTITVSISPHKENSSGEPTKNLSVIDTTLNADMAHEVFHCYEAAMAGTLANFDRAQDSWMVEGGATWVESQLVSGDAGAREWWAQYLKSPKVPLFTRTYTGIGFFAHLASSGIDPWSRFREMFAATSNPASYNVSVSLSARFLNSDASSFFREPGLGSDWDQQGADVPSPGEVGFKPPKMTVAGQRVSLPVAPYADGVYHLSLKLPNSKPVLEVKVTKGYVRMRSTNGGDVDAVEPKDLKICTDPEGCKCPKQPPVDYEQFHEGDLAITGGPTGGDVELIPHKRCEELLGSRHCENLLPGFTRPVGEAIEKIAAKNAPSVDTEHGPQKIEPGEQVSSRPGGYYVAECLFLTKGQIVRIPEEIPNGEEGFETVYTEEFEGATVVDLIVSRDPSVAQAKMAWAISRGALPATSSIKGIGDEAWWSLIPPGSIHGKPTEGETIGLRVSNIDVMFSITGESEDAGKTAALGLMSAVANELS
jgi:hypothetical protein